MKKGQSSTVFKMAIGAVFAVALLAIVYQSASGIKCPSSAVKEIDNLIKQSLNFPGECFENQVCFDNGVVVDAKYFKEKFNLGSMTINAVHAHDIISCHTNKCVFNAKITMPVKLTCDSSSNCNLLLGGKCAP